MTSALAASGLAVLVPLYIYPTSTAWEPLTSCAAQNPSTVFNVIVNPASGPGAVGSYPNSDYVANVAKLNTFPNIVTQGYVNAAYGSRSASDMSDDIATYANWSSYSGADIHLDGIFFDQTPSQYSDGIYTLLRSMATLTRNSFPSGQNEVFFNPGTASDGRLWGIPDYINGIETYSNEYATELLNNIPTSNRAKQSAIVYSFSGTAADQLSLLETFVSAGLGSVFITTQSGFQAFSDLWPDFCSGIANMTGDLAPASSSLSSAVASATSVLGGVSSLSAVLSSIVASATATSAPTVSSVTDATSSANPTSTAAAVVPGVVPGVVPAATAVVQSTTTPASSGFVTSTKSASSSQSSSVASVASSSSSVPTSTSSTPSSSSSASSSSGASSSSSAAKTSSSAAKTSSSAASMSTSSVKSSSSSALPSSTTSSSIASSSKVSSTTSSAVASSTAKTSSSASKTSSTPTSTSSTAASTATCVATLPTVCTNLANTNGVGLLLVIPACETALGPVGALVANVCFLTSGIGLFTTGASLVKCLQTNALC